VAAHAPAAAFARALGKNMVSTLVTSACTIESIGPYATYKPKSQTSLN
jgi:hypothetical protein